jgi:hypothetical protein
VDVEGMVVLVVLVALRLTECLANLDCRENPGRRGRVGADNGAEGRFLRIETKLDHLSDDVAEVRVSIARIETNLGTQQTDVAKRVSTQTYRWMVFGIIASAVLGVASFVGRLLT